MLRAAALEEGLYNNCSVLVSVIVVVLRSVILQFSLRINPRAHNKVAFGHDLTGVAARRPPPGGSAPPLYPAPLPHSPEAPPSYPQVKRRFGFFACNVPEEKMLKIKSGAAGNV